MARVSVFRLPIFWMFLGPPVFRVEAMRDGMASVQGEQDIWNIIRAVWWGVWGLFALVELARARGWFKAYFRGLGTLPVWVGLWLVALFASSAVSPSPTFTLANAFLFTFLVLGALDFAVKIYGGGVTVERALRLLLVLCVFLLILVGVTWLLSPERVGLSGRMTSGIRIRGQGQAYTPMVGQMAVYLGIFVWLASGRRFPQWHTLAAVGLGLLFLYLGKTRVAYLGSMIGLGIYAWHIVPRRKRMLFAALGVSLVGSMAAVTGFLYDASWTIRWELDRAYERYVLRDDFAISDPLAARQSFSTLNGRTEVQSVLLKEIVTKPLGLGYIAGVRSHLEQKYLDGELNVSLGGAHNAYIETWAGSGYLGLLGYLALISQVVWRSLKLRSRSPTVLAVRVLLAAVLFEGLFENEMAFPFHQSPVLFWILAASVTAMAALERRDAASAYAYDYAHSLHPEYAA